MTQEERWNKHLEEVRDYIKRHRRLPSKHRLEDHPMLYWLKYNRKLAATNKLSEERRAKFDELISYAQRYQRINQHSYVKSPLYKADLFEETQ